MHGGSALELEVSYKRRKRKKKKKKTNYGSECNSEIARCGYVSRLHVVDSKQNRFLVAGWCPDISWFLCHVGATAPQVTLRDFRLVEGVAL